MNKLTPAEQKVLKETARTYSRKLVKRTRAENEQSYAALKKSGLTAVDFDSAELDGIRAKSEAVWNNLAGKLYSPALLAEVKATLAQTRSQ